MHSKPIRDNNGKRVFDAIYRDDGTIDFELKVARQKLVIALDSVRAQLEAGQREAKMLSAARPVAKPTKAVKPNKKC